MSTKSVLLVALAIGLVTLVASTPTYWFDLLPCYGFILAVLLMVPGASSRLGHVAIVLVLGFTFFLLYTFKLQMPEYLLRYFTRPGLVIGRGMVIFETVALGILAVLMPKDFKIPYGIREMDGNKQAMLILAIYCAVSIIVRKTCGEQAFNIFFFLFSIPAAFTILFVELASPRFITACGIAVVGLSIVGIFMKLNMVQALSAHQVVLTAMMACTVIFAAILYLFRLPTAGEASARTSTSFTDLSQTTPYDGAPSRTP